MSGPPTGAAPTGLGGFPPFEPALQALNKVSATIQEAISQYESASNPKDKAAALQKIQFSSTNLTRLTTPLPQQFMELNFRPNLNVAVRIAVEMSLFESFPMSGEALTCSSIAAKTNSDAEFVLRIARVLGAFEILQESQDQNGEVAYSHTMFSRFLTSTPGKAGSKHLFEMLHAQADSAVGYYKKYGFHSPTSAKNAPFSFAHGKDDMGFFDILEAEPESMQVFKDAMTVTASLGLRELMTCYPWGELKGNEDGLVLVDVGGGKGHVVKILREAVNSFQGKGKLMLQDMGIVLDGGVMEMDGEVALMPYDFFKQVQPVKGANYFFRSIFHDWPDSFCLQILRNLAPAMKPTPSNPAPKLLICDLVLPDHSPPAPLTLRDMNMLVIGGKERSLSQWQKLLGEGDFKILGVHGEQIMPAVSVLECVLA